MNKLYTTVFGSALYGTTTPTSDKDFKYIYLPDFDDVLLGKHFKNRNETTGNKNSKNGVDDIDKEYIPIQVFLNDFFSGQSYALEIAFGVKPSNFKLVCCALTSRYIHKNVDSMVGFAVAQAIKYGMKGNRLKALEQLTLGLSKHDGDMLLGDVPNLTEIIDSDKIFITEYQINEDEDTAPCINVLGKIYPFNIKVSTAFKRAQKAINSYGARAKAAIEEGIDWKSLHHALRVSYQCIELLQDGHITLPLTGDVLSNVMEVKLGNVDYKDVIDEIATNLDIIEELKKTTRLPEQEELVDDFREFKLNTLKHYYGL